MLCLFQILTLIIHYRCRWGTVHCLTHCTRRRWKSSWSFTNHLPELQQSGRGAKAAVHNSGDTLVHSGSLCSYDIIVLDHNATLHRTLFHALSVNAAAKDPAFHYGGVSSVANSMIGRPLIFLFSLIFSFRLCQSILQLQGLCPPFCQVIVDDFEGNAILDNTSQCEIFSHVSSLGFLPTNPDQTILWLWTIHNIANR